MKKVLFVVVLGVVLGAAAPSAWRVVGAWKAESAARERLERVFRSMESGDEQQAVSAWAQDKIVMSYDDLQTQQPRFESFWNSSGLATRNGWRIASVEADRDTGVVYADVTSGGEHVWLVVPPEAPIEVDEGD